MPEVSVVIPTKDEEKSIGICIERVLRVFNDNHIDGEIIVADSSSICRRNDFLELDSITKAILKHASLERGFYLGRWSS